MTMLGRRRASVAGLGDTGGGGGDIWFTASHEGTDTSEWNGPSVSTPGSSSASWGVSSTRSHDGTQAMFITLTDSEAGTGVRMRCDNQPVNDGVEGATTEENLPNDGYYSTWFYIPEHITLTDDEWNIFQFKESSGSTKVLKESLKLWDQGASYGATIRSNTLADGTFSTSNPREWKTNVHTVSAGQWFNIEMRRIWSDDPAVGRLTVWFDNIEIFDEFLKTEHNFENDQFIDRQWTVNSYHTGGSGIHHSPNTHTLWIDEAVVSTAKVN